jgi:hypothetical protein
MSTAAKVSQTLSRVNKDLGRELGRINVMIGASVPSAPTCPNQKQKA